ncbi:MAG: protein kinase, partial [Myxococcota bacterium]
MIGAVLGKYRIVEKIGDGGMGTVYLAEQPGIGRRAAIKVLHKQYFHDDEIRTRFFNEAKAIGQLRHPGIVELYDYSDQRDEHAFIVMEFLQGEDLSKRLRRVGRLPVNKALLIARQVAQALGAAHDKGVIHRDLKPDNLFLVRPTGVEKDERIKILDFGVAKLLDQERATNKTQTGTVIGTPPYMSPEQCKGNARVDHRADLYALGCILFRMMCGRTPFVSNGYGEMLAAHIHETPPSPRSIEPSIPPVFDSIILRLLAKDPDERFPDSYGLIDALDDAVANTHLGLPEPVVQRGTRADSDELRTQLRTPSGDWVVDLRSSEIEVLDDGRSPGAGTPHPQVATPHPQAGTPYPQAGTPYPPYPVGSHPVRGTPAPQRAAPDSATRIVGDSSRYAAPPPSWNGRPSAPMAVPRPIDSTTLSSAAAGMQSVTTASARPARRASWIAIGVAVCAVSAVATLFALQVGPFAPSGTDSIVDSAAAGRGASGGGSDLAAAGAREDALPDPVERASD